GCLLWPGSVAWLAFWLFVAGACSGALYPLGLALLGERTLPASMSRASAWFLAINCAGSLTGPVVAGVAMDLFGRAALFVAGGGALGAVLAAWGISAACRRREETTPGANAHGLALKTTHPTASGVPVAGAPWPA